MWQQTKNAKKQNLKIRGLSPTIQSEPDFSRTCSFREVLDNDFKMSLIGVTIRSHNILGMKIFGQKKYLGRDLFDRKNKKNVGQKYL